MWCAFQSENNRGREMKTKMKKLIKRIEALEEQIKSPGLLMKITEDLSSLPSFRCKTVAIKEEPKPVSVGRYKPMVGEEYCFIDEYGDICSKDNDDTIIDNHEFSLGNCYRTSQEAEQSLLRQRALVRVNDRIDELNGGWVADWSRGSEKAFIDSMSVSGRIYFAHPTREKRSSIFNPASSSYILNKVVSEMEEDIKLAAGWE